MSTEDLFSTNSTADTGTTSVPLFEGEPNRAPAIDPNKDWMSEYVGEGKKFKDAAALARGKAESDAFIYRLQQETEGLRKELQTRIKLEEFMDRMNSQNSGGSSQTTQTAGDGTTNDGAASNATSTPDIEKLIEERLTKKEAEIRERANIEAARNRLQEALGPDFQQELAARTEALGLTKDFVANLAKTQPKALYALLGIEGQAPAQKQDNSLFAPRGTVNTAGMNQSSGGSEKNWAYYEKLRKQNPGAYWSTSVQAEIHKSAERLGERFYS